MTKIKLGKRYKDKLHGIEGVAVARTEFLHGCARVTLEILREGKIENFHFDEVQLEGITVTKKTKKGGPGNNVPRASSPERK